MDHNYHQMAKRRINIQDDVSKGKTFSSANLDCLESSDKGIDQSVSVEILDEGDISEYLSINHKNDYLGIHSKTRVGQDIIHHVTTDEFQINTLEESINEIENDSDQYQDYRSTEVECNNMTCTETVTIEDEDIEFMRTDENISPEKTFVLPQYNFDRKQVLIPSIENDTHRGICKEITVAAAEGRRTRRYFCIYCKRMYSKFPQHLQTSHKTENAVKQFMLLPSGCTERKKIIETIRRRGDFLHNTDPKYNSGNLLVARRSHLGLMNDPKNYTPCPSCNGFFSKATIRFHVKHCMVKRAKGSRTIMVMSRSLIVEVHPRACDTLKNRIFPVMREDECASIIRHDLLTILMGNYWVGLYPDSHHDDMVRSRLRLIGRLLLLSRATDQSALDFISLLVPEKYDLVIFCIKKIAGLNQEGLQYKSPTTATSLTTICKKAAEIWKVECIKSSDVQAQQRAENFLQLFKMSCTSAISRTAMENRIQHQRQKIIELPSRDDISKLVTFLRVNRRKWFEIIQSIKEGDLFNAWKNLASFTLISMMVFNRRRPGELERITIDDYNSAQSADSIISQIGNLTPSDIGLARRYKRFEIRGKLNRVVPVLVNFEIQTCLDVIISKRLDVGVSSTNPYVFGLPSLERTKHLRAYVLLREYASKCGATKPHLLRGTQLRKQIATECAVRDLSENVVKDVANFMGHALNIHDNIYRLPVHTRDIVQMSKVLEMVGGKDDCPSDGDSEEESLVRKSITSASAHSSTPVVDESLGSTPPCSNIEQESSNIEQERRGNVFNDEIQSKKSKTSHISGLKRICGRKTPWSSKEKDAAIKHFGKFLKENKLPSSTEVFDKLPFIKELQSRSPTSVRLWLHNELKSRAVETHAPNTPDTPSIPQTPNTLYTPSIKHKDKKIPVKRIRWSIAMKDALQVVFREHLQDGTLPGNAECVMAAEQFPVLRSVTAAALKTAVANELKRRS